MTRKNIINIFGIFIVAVLFALAVELVRNIPVLTLPDEQKGTISVSSSKEIFDSSLIVEGKPEEGLVYRSHEEYKKYDGRSCYHVDYSGYADKLIVGYTNESASYFDVLYTYVNMYGYVESGIVKDANPVYLDMSTINIGHEVVDMWIIPMENNTPECVNSPVVTAVSVVNRAYLNHFVFLFVMLLVTCAGFLVLYREHIHRHLEYGFLVIAVTAGFIMCLAMPLSRVVWDEESHLRGVYWLDITGSYEYNSFLQGYIDGSYENLPFEYSMSYEEYDRVFDTVNRLSTPSESDPATSHRWGTSGFGTFSYVIMAVTCNLCKLLGAPFGLTYILVRFTNLVMYITVVFFAIRKLPCGKLLMSAIALMPTPMFIASTVSYDTIVTSFIYLGLAYLLAIIMSDKKLTWWEYLVFIGGIAYGSSRKAIYIPLILLGMMIPANCFKDKKQEKIMKAGIILVFLALMSTFVLPAIISPSAEGDLRGGTTSHAGQISVILSNPFGYAFMMLKSMWESLFDFMVGTISLDHMAYLGSGTMTYVIVIYLVTLTLTSVSSEGGFRYKLPGFFKTAVYFLVFVVMCLIWTSMYLSYTEIGKTVMAGVQGRYYIPLLFPILLMLGTNSVKSGINKKKYSLAALLTSAFILFYSVWEILLRQCSL